MCKTSENLSMTMKCIAYKLKKLGVGAEESLVIFLTLKEGEEEEQEDWLMWLEYNNPTIEQIYKRLVLYIEMKREVEPTFLTGGRMNLSSLKNKIL